MVNWSPMYIEKWRDLKYFHLRYVRHAGTSTFAVQLRIKFCKMIGEVLTYNSYWFKNLHLQANCDSNLLITSTNEPETLYRRN